MNRPTKIALTIGSELATMLAAAVVLIAVTEGLNWAMFWKDRP